MTQVSNGIYGKLTVIRANGNDANFFPLNGLETTLGRDPACQVQLRSWEISRIHAKIVFDADTREATLVDCSTNGMMINSQLVTEPTLLKNNDVIELGQRTFRFEKSDPISASKMTCIQQKLKNSPGFFQRKVETVADLPPTPIKKRSTQMPMQKMLFKGLISAKYADKELDTESEMDASKQSSMASIPTNCSPQKEIESPSKKSEAPSLHLIQCSLMKNPSKASPRKKMDSPNVSKVGLAQRVKVTPNSAPRSMGDKLAIFKKSLSVSNTPKGQVNLLKQLKDAKKIVKASPKGTCTTTPNSVNNGKNGSSIQKSQLSSRQASVKKSVTAFQSVAKAAQSGTKQSSILDASKESFFEQVQDFVGIQKIARAAEKFDVKISPESESNRRRSVTFGPPLEPEIFDKRNAPSSPLTRGEPAPQVSSKDGTPAHKSILKMANEERLSAGSRKVTPRSNVIIAEVNCSSPLSRDARMLDMSAPQSVKSTNSNLALDNDILLLNEELHDGLTSSSVEGLASSEAEIGDAPLQQAMEVVELVSEGAMVVLAAETEQILNTEEECYSGLKGLLKTPKSFYQKDGEISGLSTPFDSPKVKSTLNPVDTAPAQECAEESLSQEKSEPCYIGVKNLLKTPKPDIDVSYLGLKETLKTPVHCNISSVNLVGIKELLHTPKEGSIPNLVGIKEILKTPKPAHTLENLEGVKELLQTPVASIALKKEAEEHVVQKEAHEQVVQPPKVTRSLRPRGPAAATPALEESVSTEIKSAEEKENLKSIPANTFYSKSATPLVIQNNVSKIPLKKSRKRHLEEKPDTDHAKKTLVENVSNLRRSSRLNGIPCPTKSQVQKICEA